jgi:hypothetical protein
MGRMGCSVATEADIPEHSGTKLPELLCSLAVGMRAEDALGHRLPNRNMLSHASAPTLRASLIRVLMITHVPHLE